MNRLFLVVFSLFLAFLSCKSSQPALHSESLEKSTLPPSFFSLNQLYTYHTEINAYGRIITGIIRIKKTDSSIFKLSFANETGFQLMALSFENGEMTSHEVFEKLDKKIILKNFEKGMQMLFFHSLCKGIFAAEKQKEISANCFNGKEEFHYKTKDGKMSKIQVFKKGQLQKWISFDSYEDDIPKEITIKHEDIRVSYNLKYLNNG